MSSCQSRRGRNTKASRASGRASRGNTSRNTASRTERAGPSSWLAAACSCSLPPSAGGSALRLGIVGAAGAGKTSLLVELCGTLSRRTRVLLYDPMQHIPAWYTDSEARYLRNVSNYRVGVTGTDDPELALRIADIARRTGECVVIWEEAHDLCPRLRTDPRALQLIRQGRNNGVGLVWADQRSTACATDLTGNSQAMLVGRQLGPADLAYARSWGVLEPMRPFHFRGVFPDGTIEIRSRRY